MAKLPRERVLFGTCVALSTSIGRRPVQFPADRPVKEDGVTDANILLVDDDAQFIDIMKKRLTMRRMEVFHAGSGEEAMQKLAAHGEIEVGILDVKLPGRSGIDCSAETTPNRSFARGIPCPPIRSGQRNRGNANGRLCHYAEPYI